MIIRPLIPLVSSMLGLTKNEQAVFDAVRAVPMSARAVQIARKCGIPRYTTNRILKNFEQRSIVSSITIVGKETRWQYNRKIDKLRVRFHMFEPSLQTDE